MNWKQGIIAAAAVIIVALAGWFAYPLLRPAPPPQPLFADWAAIVVAGDWRAQSGQPSDVFDNGRRDVAAKLLGIGFKPENMLQFSVQPQKFTSENVQPSTGEAITYGLARLARNATGVCLLYFTSHGTEQGMIVGDRLVDPPPLADLVDVACGERPAILILSACYSGKFVGALKGPNHIVFTSSRDDRTSFGCGEQDQHTFFDTCVLQQFDKVGNFTDLAAKVSDCVAAREKEMKITEPSEPQFFVGPGVAYNLSWK